MKLAIAIFTVLLQITLQATVTPTAADEAAKGQATPLIWDASFEDCPSGLLASTGANRVWEVQRTGRKTIQEQLVVACVEDEAKARSGNKCLSLSIPKETEGFEFVTVGQRLGLEAGKVYEASRTWYGPVDQVLQSNAEWNTYRFAHIPPVGGPWKLYVQLNGWGNFSRAVTVSLDDFTCTPAAALSTPP